MIIYNNNPIVHQACRYAVQYDQVLDNCKYHMTLRGEFFPYMESTYKRRFENIKDDYFWCIDSDSFFRTNHRYLPLDLAVDLNIEMAKHLIYEQIDNKGSGNPF